MKNEIKGVYNISSSKKIRLTEIAKIISKHYKKVITFELNKNPTYLIGNNFRLRKIYKKKIDTKLKKLFLMIKIIRKEKIIKKTIDRIFI